MRVAALACLIGTVSLARVEGQSILVPNPPVKSISTTAPSAASSSAGLNQAAMSQVISQLNQRQFQLSVAAAQASAQRPVFVPQKIIINRSK